MKLNLLLIITCFCLLGCKNKKAVANEERTIWTSEKANYWYKGQNWTVGANFLPSTASNQLEMWQAETFDSVTIDRELGFAESLGMNSSRVFLHDLLHQQDSVGFYSRMNTFLNIAKKHNIKPLIVFFDSCWDPFPHLGKQRAPKPFVHNSAWVQSPGYYALKDSNQYNRLEKYVTGVVTKFANDDRILAWDIWNEPDNLNVPAYEKVDLPEKVKYVLPLLTKAFVWARKANPAQPITSGIWVGDWSTHEIMKPIERLQIEQSDLISFHNYDKPEEFEKRILQLKRYNKPILCTEYMARPNGSTFQGFLPIAKKYNVAMYNWGFVNGKSQTIFPWDSWRKQYQAEPPVWFHDIFQKDGTPYRVEETKFIQGILSQQAVKAN